MMLEYFKMAFRSLKRRKLRSWLTMIGIVIGITSVVALIGLGQGLQVAISSLFGDLGTDKLTVTASGGYGPPGTGVTTPVTKDNLEKIRRIDGVDAAAGRLIEAGKLEFNEKVGFGYAASLPTGDSEGRRLIEEALDLEAEQGRLLKDIDNNKVLLGNQFSQLGEYFGKDIVPGSRITLQGRDFEIVGILKKQGNFLLDSLVIMNDDEMRSLFDIPDDELDVIVVQVKDRDSIKDVKLSIEKMLRKERGVRAGEEDFSVSSPEEALESVNSTLGAVNLFVYVIAGISILVGGIGIMNTMFMSVAERTKDIGIMKSIGAKNSTIFSLFFIESGLLGCVGGLAGAIVGSLIAIAGSMGLQSFLGGDIEIRAQIGPVLFMGSVLGAFAVGSLFGIIPAMRASGMHPVDALSHRK